MYTYDCLLFSHSVISDSLRNCGLQHTRLPCPPSSPRACPNSCPLSQWCHPTYLVAFNFFQYQGLLKSVRSSHQVAKVLEFQAQHQSFQWIFRTDFLYDWLIWSPWSPRDSQESSSTSQFKSINSLALSLLYGPTLTSIHDYWKNNSSDYMDFVCKVMSLLLNMLSLSQLFFQGVSLF